MTPDGAAVSVGAEVGGSRRREVEHSSKSGVDIIFAYQLHVIAEKGWRKKNLEVRTYKGKHAFLGEQTPGGGDHQDSLEVELATEEYLLGAITTSQGGYGQGLESVLLNGGTPEGADGNEDDDQDVVEQCFCIINDQ